MNSSRPRPAARRPLPADIDAVIFDCDGLLVDTEERWAVAESALFARHGLGYGPAEKELFIGVAAPVAAARMAAMFGRPGAEERILVELEDGAAVAIAERADPQPGALDLVRRLEAARPVAVASNSSRRLLELALVSGGLAHLRDRSVSAEEVARPKPAPDLYLRACELLGVEPSRCVAFEDSATGAASARAAGLYVIAVPSLPGELEHDWCLASLADPELLAWVESLPAR